MNILIIDDDYIKVDDSKKALSNMLPNAVFTFAWNGCDALRELTPATNSAQYDLIILDMQFPFREGQNIDARCGIKVLEQIRLSQEYANPQKRIDDTIPVIICSSMQYPHELDSYDNVKGYIRYGYGGQDLTNQYELLLPALRKCLSQRQKIHLSESDKEEYSLEN